MEEQNAKTKKVETPLVAILPEKFHDIDVTEFLPDLHTGKVNISSMITVVVDEECEKYLESLDEAGLHSFLAHVVSGGKCVTADDADVEKDGNETTILTPSTAQKFSQMKELASVDVGSSNMIEVRLQNKLPITSPSAKNFFGAKKSVSEDVGSCNIIEVRLQNELPMTFPSAQHFFRGKKLASEDISSNNITEVRLQNKLPTTFLSAQDFSKATELASEDVGSKNIIEVRLRNELPMMSSFADCVEAKKLAPEDVSNINISKIRLQNELPAMSSPAQHFFKGKMLASEDINSNNIIEARLQNELPTTSLCAQGFFRAKELASENVGSCNIIEVRLRNELPMMSPSVRDFFEAEELAHVSCSNTTEARLRNAPLTTSPFIQNFFEAKKLAFEDVGNNNTSIIEVRLQNELHLAEWLESSILPPSAPISPRPLNVSLVPVKPNAKELEIPAAEILPKQYENIDVKELFPDFRYGKVLRFSRIFERKKSPLLPKIWRSLKKRQRRKKRTEKELPRKIGWTLNYATPPSSPSRIMLDDEVCLLRQHVEDKENETQENVDIRLKLEDWRFGPAQFWYDMLGIPETDDGFDYGFEQKDPVKTETSVRSNIPDESFLMVSQITWEDDIIWDDNEETKQKVMKHINCKTDAAGWVSTISNKTAETFSKPCKDVLPPTGSSVKPDSNQMNSANELSQKDKCPNEPSVDNSSDDTWYSIFPVENEELVYGTWEDEVIWDPECISHIPKPKILTLDPNDENIILGIPDDIDPQKQRADNATHVKVKIPNRHMKQSKLLLEKAGVINVLEEDTPPPSKSPDHDPFNVSNDRYYLPCSSKTSLKLKIGDGTYIQHATPVAKLQAPFVQTEMSPTRLRKFHRPPLKRYSYGEITRPGFHSVTSLTKFIKERAELREQERIASGGGDVFFMRTPEDLTGRDGELILVEFSEEHPPLINQVGMCSKIKNYYKPKGSEDEGPTHFRYGEPAYAHTSPFLGVLLSGKSLQAIENNMYRAPVYEHKIPETDFLVLRTRHRYFIREIDSLFTAGQLCPLYEVPNPNSKQASYFVRNFLLVFLYRLFWRSEHDPKRIKMDIIKKAFPSHTESQLRKSLKRCAEFKRTGVASNFWVMKPDFRLPLEEEIQAMVSPEQYCTYFSMIAAKQRLKDAGYGEKFLFNPEDDDEDLQLQVGDEMKAAPWNTTRAFIQAMKGKSMLQLTGPADPTGCGEGFSYVPMSNKPESKSKYEQEQNRRRLIFGTDADLRRLPLEKAKNLLYNFGIQEETIKTLSRWEVIDLIRTLSTEKAKAGEEDMTQFSRGNRFSVAEHQERYKEECQRIFDLQNQVLSSCEVLSTDEDDSDVEETGNNVDTVLEEKKTNMPLALESEQTKDNEDSFSGYSNSQPDRVLKIYRTFQDFEGKEYTRMEVIRKQTVIDAYVKIRTSKTENFIKQFAGRDDAGKEEVKREKRRIQEQLRRIKKNLEEERSGIFRSHSKKCHPSELKTHKVKIKPELKVTCGACGATGHMRTNKACPQYQLNALPPPVNAALTQEQENEISKQLNEDAGSLINVDDAKVDISGNFIKDHNAKRHALMQKLSRNVSPRKRKSASEIHCDTSKKQSKPTNRKPSNPLVVLTTILESILKEVQALPDVQPFLFPIKAKKLPDYCNVVTKPLDLRTIRKNLRLNKYQTRQDFLTDVHQIVLNSTLHNGEGSTSTEAAKKLLKHCVDRLVEKEDKLIRLEKMINALLDNNDPVALSCVLEKVMDKLKVANSLPSLKLADNDNIKYPIDLETISKNVKDHKYQSREEFLADLGLILENCVICNDIDFSFTEQAQNLLKIAELTFKQYDEDEHVTRLQNKMELVQERAESDSFSSRNNGDDDKNQEKLSNPPTNSQSQNDLGNPMDFDSVHEVLHKPESHQLHAKGIHYFTKVDKADNDKMEEIKRSKDNANDCN